MCKTLLFTLTALGVAVTPAIAQIQQRAQIVGGGSNTGGRCTVALVVDGAADVVIRGDMANLRDISGQQPQFRRFECTGIMPPNPVNFQFRTLAGRGRQMLLRDPRNGGTAEVRVEDPEPGADTYAFELLWSNGDFGPGPGQDRYGDRDRFMQTFDAGRVMRQCQDAVRREAMERYNASDIAFPDARIDDDHDWVRGRIEVLRGPGRQGQYQFSCALNRDTGQVRSVRIDPMQGGFVNPGAAAPVTGRAMQNCQRAVTERLRNDGYGRVEFGNMNLDSRPGRGDWIQGSVKGMHADTSDFFNFSCSVNLRDGDLRSVDVTRR